MRRICRSGRIAHFPCLAVDTLARLCSASTLFLISLSGNAREPTSEHRNNISLRVDYEPGYRVYFAQRGKALLMLLCGGDKRTQDGMSRGRARWWQSGRN